MGTSQLSLVFTLCFNYEVKKKKIVGRKETLPPLAEVGGMVMG